MNTSIVTATILVSVCGILLSGCANTEPQSEVVQTDPEPPIHRTANQWERLWNNSATVEVLNMKPVPLVVGDDKQAWARVPSQFSEYHTSIFAVEGPTEGVADYKVTKGGYLLVACNFAYQGNNSGGWEESRWTREQFLERGWREMSAEELGGVLVKGDSREQVIFVKTVVAGESGRLRCNKYDPPYLIVVSNKPVK